MSRTYLDHAATTPMLPEAVRAMTNELTRVGNASAAHGSGRAARRVVEDARDVVAARLRAEPMEVIFTSGGTEADNLAVKGAYWSRATGIRRRVVTSAVEHHAVLDSVGWLVAAEGAAASYLSVDSSGRVSPEDVWSAVSADTAVATVMWANNEVGALQPVADVAAAARSCGAVSHSDAVQAVGHVPIDFTASGLDLLSFTAHKLGGPYGVGALLARREVGLTALLHGGGQEREIRSGTVDVAAIAGFAAAVEVAVGKLEQESRRLRALRAQLLHSVLAAVPDAVPLGPEVEVLPSIVCVRFPGCAAESLLLLLDAEGIDCSAGPACTAGVARPSHVLTALGLSADEAMSTLRFSLGATSSGADIAALAAALPAAVERSRAAAAVAAVGRA